jgi:hypothetical protein
MATVYNGTRMTAANLITGAGKLLGILVSHAQATVQTVTFYDNTAASGTVLLTLYIDPNRCPTYIRFPLKNPIEFSTGLSATYTNCELNVWAVDYA